jgi:hypothetical protein
VGEGDHAGPAASSMSSAGAGASASDDTWRSNGLRVCLREIGEPGTRQHRC